MPKKKRIALIILFLLILIVIIIVCVIYFGTKKPKVLTLYGNVDIRNVDLSFRVPGRIIKLFYEEGAQIKKGAVLARLDSNIYTASLAMAKAKLEQAIVAKSNSEKTFTRRSKLITYKAVSQALFDEAEAQYKESIAQIGVAKADVDQSQINLNDTVLYAPSDGFILTRVREEGAVVEPTQAVYTLTLENFVWVRIFVSEVDLGKVRPGQLVSIYTDSRPNKPYHGHIGFISPQAEFTPKTVETTDLRTELVYRARIVVDKDTEGLLQGMPVTVKINLDNKNVNQNG